MSNATHTPGPWNVSRHATPDYAPQFGIYAGESARDLATVTGDNAAADAALIEAAPDLLAALEDALDDLNAFRRAIPMDKWPDKPVVHTMVRDKAVAAIAKAKGGAA